MQLTFTGISPVLDLTGGVVVAVDLRLDSWVSSRFKFQIRMRDSLLNLTTGNIVTTTRADMMYVVTEHGIANLKGKSVPERALALIAIAHPDFREDLEREAHEHRMIPRGFTFGD